MYISLLYTYSTSHITHYKHLPSKKCIIISYNEQKIVTSPVKYDFRGEAHKHTKI